MEKKFLNESQKAKIILKEIKENFDKMTKEEQQQFFKKYGFVFIKEDKLKKGMSK